MDDLGDLLRRLRKIREMAQTVQTTVARARRQPPPIRPPRMYNLADFHGAHGRLQ
jgi:hypothetical protein